MKPYFFVVGLTPRGRRGNSPTIHIATSCRRLCRLQLVEKITLWKGLRPLQTSPDDKRTDCTARLEPTRTEGRSDLTLILMQGVPVVTAMTQTVPSDQLRLNTAIAPTAAVGRGKPLGVPAGDLAGFPNGRRLEDDVTDVGLRVVADGYGELAKLRSINRIQAR
jgi:hypothetical protein